MKIVIDVLLAVISLVLLAHLRNRVMFVVTALFNVPVTLLTTVGRALRHHAIPALDRRTAEILDHLAYTHPANDHQVTTGPAWDVAGPIVYLSLFLILVFGDLYLFGLRLAALLQIGSPTVAVPIDWLGAIVWAAMLASLGMVWLDLKGATAISRPWHNLSSRTRQFLLIIVSAALVIALLAAMLFFLWGQLVVDGQPVPLLGWIFIAAFGGTLQIAILVAGAALLSSGLILWFVVVSGLRLAARAALLTIMVMVWLLDKIAELFVAVYDLAAHLGRGLWNWFVSFAGNRLHLNTIDWAPRVALGTELHRTLLSPPERDASPRLMAAD